MRQDKLWRRMPSEAHSANPGMGQTYYTLWRLTNACTGLRARVVYSRLFPDSTPDRTRPQAGRLNKSPHTVHSFANRPKKKFAIAYNSAIISAAIQRSARNF